MCFLFVLSAAVPALSKTASVIAPDCNHDNCLRQFIQNVSQISWRSRIFLISLVVRTTSSFCCSKCSILLIFSRRRNAHFFILKARSITTFCAAYTSSASASLPTFVSQCTSDASRLSSACSCMGVTAKLPSSTITIAGTPSAANSTMASVSSSQITSALDASIKMAIATVPVSQTATTAELDPTALSIAAGAQSTTNSPNSLASVQPTLTTSSVPAIVSKAGQNRADPDGKIYSWSTFKLQIHDSCLSSNHASKSKNLQAKTISRLQFRRPPNNEPPQQHTNHALLLHNISLSDTMRELRRRRPMPQLLLASSC